MLQMLKKLFIFLLILSYSKSQAQVNLQHGSAEFSLPVFNWQDHKSRLHLNISLNYSSGKGLRVDDIASNVGQGWNLLAGGAITRIQAGEPDDQKAYSETGTGDDLKQYPDGNFYERTEEGIPNALARYPIYKDKNHLYKVHNNVKVDKEMDLFSFQFNGRSGMFILGKGYLGIESPAILGDTKLKIWFDKDESLVNRGIRTTIKAFYIQDEDGIIYHFEELELTKVLKTSFSDKNLNKQSQPKFKNNKVYHQASYDEDDPLIVNPYIINGWYLKKIEDPLTGRTIKITYDSRSLSVNSGTSIANYTSKSSQLFSSEKNYSIITHLKSVTKTPFINSIVFEDGHTVHFKYGDKRLDLNGDKVLSKIEIKYKERYVSAFELNTTYFILNRLGTPRKDLPNKYARLCLRSVIKTGVDLKESDPPYIFDYYLGSSEPDDFVPPPFYHLKDIWGYYNGSNSSVSTTKSLDELSNDEIKKLCFQNGNIYNAKNNYAKNGLLKQITYPTGGSLVYEYEQNNTVLKDQNVLGYGVHVAKTLVTDGGFANDCDDPLSTSYKYVMEGSGLSSLWGTEPSVNIMNTENSYEPAKKQWFKVKLFPPSVGCDYRYKYPGILNKEDAVSTSFTMQSLQFALNVYSTYSTIRAVTSALASDPVTLIIQVVLDFAITCFISPDMTNRTTIYYNRDLNNSNPLPVQFKRVEITENDGSNGKTVSEFTSDDEYPVWFNSNPLFSMKQRYAYWAYGLPRKTAIFDGSGAPVSETEYIYDLTFLQREFDTFKYSSPYYSFKALVTKNTSLRSDEWNNPDNYNNPSPSLRTKDMDSNEYMKVDAYKAYTGRYNLEKTIMKVFKNGNPNQYFQTVNEFTYNEGGPDNNFEINSIKTTQSNGDIQKKYLTYYNDFYRHIFSKPLSIATSYTKSGETVEYFTGESVTKYTNVQNGNLVPSNSLVRRFGAPLPSGQMTYYPSNLSLYKETESFIYDNNSNLAGMVDEGNRVISNIYDYDDKYIVATVVNAHPLVDKPAYTSFETNVLITSGWIFTGTENYSNQSITGERSLVLSSGQSLTSSGINTIKSYKLSFWANNHNVTPSNGTLVKTGPVVNGFTYFEYNIPAGTSSVKITGNASIDELRLYPQNSRMQTITYDPLIGKTSECDENNRITYYEYDAGGRMRFIKDENRNVIKMFEYNLKDKVAACPRTFENLRVSEIFTKNNCSQGYMGGEVSYVIPAGKYTSAISQEEVDQKVQAELDTYGQTYANANGTCIKLYYNAAVSREFTKEGCDLGYKGTSVVYTIPAKKYSSTISQADADEQATDDLDANGDAYVNYPGNASCVIDYEPYWEGEENSLKKCETLNGRNTGRQLVLVKDINPNSPSFNSTQWVALGENTAECPKQNCTKYKIIVPATKTQNLYIEYFDCSTGTKESRSWHTQLVVDEEEHGMVSTTICVSSGFPAFKYGSTGIIVDIPEIQVIFIGTCP